MKTQVLLLYHNKLEDLIVSENECNYFEDFEKKNNKYRNTFPEFHCNNYKKYNISDEEIESIKLGTKMSNLISIENNDWVYKGDMNASGKRWGFGVILYKSGEVMKGFWRDNKLHGFGRYITDNGELYEGIYL